MHSQVGSTSQTSVSSLTRSSWALSAHEHIVDGDDERSADGDDERSADGAGALQPAVPLGKSADKKEVGISMRCPVCAAQLELLSLRALMAIDSDYEQGFDCGVSECGAELGVFKPETHSLDSAVSAVSHSESSGSTAAASAAVAYMVALETLLYHCRCCGFDACALRGVNGLLASYQQTLAHPGR